MNEYFGNTIYFGIVISLASYFLGMWLKKKTKLPIFNPLLVAITISIFILAIFKIDYETYNSSAKILSWFLTSATVCLAIPLYEQRKVLGKNVTAIMCSLLAGVLASLTTIFLLSLVMKFGHVEYVTILPKSVTNAIGTAICEELGGFTPICVTVIAITGVSGDLFGVLICKIFRIEEPISQGLSLGASAHMIGTSRALQLGTVQGAVSSLAVGVSGLLTVVLAPIYAMFL